MSLDLKSRSRIDRLMEVVRPTTFISPYALQNELGAEIHIASESFQITGSFKFRAAYNLASNVRNEMLITASSGNFGQALACACQMLGKKCIVVMPDNSAKIKVQATKDWGAQVELVDTKVKTRAERLGEIADMYPQAYKASAYDDLFVIEGNASLGLEIGNSGFEFDQVIVPIGGGGLSAGVVSGIKASCRPQLEVYGAEPALANDASLSLKRGEIVAFSQEAQTVADGARTLSLGKHNFAILKDGLSGIFEVEEESIKNAVRKIFLKANLKLEPTGTLAIAAVMQNKDRFAGKRVLCVASGGNVDPELFCRLLVDPS